MASVWTTTRINVLTRPSASATIPPMKQNRVIFAAAAVQTSGLVTSAA